MKVDLDAIVISGVTVYMESMNVVMQSGRRRNAFNRHT